MTIEPSQETFRRLVQAYLVVGAISLVVAIVEMLNWSEFSDEFDQLSMRHFGEPSDIEGMVLAALAIPAFLAHIVAMFGLLRFRSWARTLSWTTLIVMLLPMAIPSFSITWSSSWTVALEIGLSTLFGMILLLAYSRDHGALWFAAARP